MYNNIFHDFNDLEKVITTETLNKFIKFWIILFLQLFFIYIFIYIYEEKLNVDVEGFYTLFSPVISSNIHRNFNHIFMNLKSWRRLL